VTDVRGQFPSYSLEHLSCFLPGLLALGAHSLSPNELSPEARKLHAWAAEGLANTCWASYHDSATGLGPDIMYFPSGSVKWTDALKMWDGVGLPPGVGDAERKTEDFEYGYKSGAYLLRPEVRFRQHSRPLVFLISILRQ
jgi:mannosyl-oligosaccharide alpha-1,2-mannosidase